MDDGPVIVTGCQRSGTTIASHILGEEKKWVVWEDQDWLPTPKDIYILQEMVRTGRLSNGWEHFSIINRSQSSGMGRGRY